MRGVDNTNHGAGDQTASIVGPGTHEQAMGEQRFAASIGIQPTSTDRLPPASVRNLAGSQTD